MGSYIAVDLGASSGRLILGTLNNKTLELKELYRFENGGIELFDCLYWDILYLYNEIIEGLKKFTDSHGNRIDGIGIDTWGVDFVLLDRNDELVGLPHHYRDQRTDNMIKEIAKVVPKMEIYKKTGIQFSRINSLTQLFSMVFHNSPQLEIAHTFLLTPDFLNFLLTGRKCSEYTIATTTQLYNSINKNWAYELIEKFSLNKNWFSEIIQPGTIIGTILPMVNNKTGLAEKTKIIAPGSHDTASAIAAVPVLEKIYKKRKWAYISSGTWSLMGIETDTPIINKKAFQYNFTNEGGISNTIRFLKNLTGMWIIQECKRIWNENGKDVNWNQIDQKAKNADPFKFYINPDDPAFISPLNMVESIRNYCKKHRQDIPETIGEISRTIFESLAFRYRQIFINIEEILQDTIKALFIVGGGSKNGLLNQFAASSLNIPVFAGPIEATAIGNILTQAMANGKIKSLQELRKIVRNSFEIDKFLPQKHDQWQNKFHEYLSYTGQKSN
ncbi:MAG: Rhamnulokinase [Promethearchaeota archaeon]|nr:MAG: Rhamnulokinase [Candidatus Lokiarchaeota archaeon]